MAACFRKTLVVSREEYNEIFGDTDAEMDVGDSDIDDSEVGDESESGESGSESEIESESDEPIKWGTAIFPSKVDMICEQKGNLVYTKWHDNKRDVNILSTNFDPLSPKHSQRKAKEKRGCCTCRETRLCGFVQHAHGGKLIARINFTRIIALANPHTSGISTYFCLYFMSQSVTLTLFSKRMSTGRKGEG